MSATADRNLLPIHVNLMGMIKRLFIKTYLEGPTEQVVLVFQPLKLILL